MKKIHLFFIFLFILILFLGIYVAIVRSPVTGNQILSIEDLTNKQMTLILIENFSFVPNEITINKGDWVHWSNKDEVMHILIFENGLYFEIPAKKSSEYKFNESGIYNYSCKIHHGMKGKIIVK